MALCHRNGHVASTDLITNMLYHVDASLVFVSNSFDLATSHTPASSYVNAFIFDGIKCDFLYNDVSFLCE
ncbi:MAG: hypothetical protein EOM20_06295 [Spartobacteria bacterium]|nr:hypothetical protein [Spartobacteria bacterium]